MLSDETSDRRNLTLDGALADARARLTEAHPKSLGRHRAAAAALPGGNTRAVLFYEPFPLTFVGGRGCRVATLDGPELIDLVSEYSAGLYGHSDPVIAAALEEAVRRGLALGGPNTYEAAYAAALVERFPTFERVRFCNSGTEANIMALSTARAFTGRPLVIAMKEAYHGGVLTFAHGGSPLNLPFPMVFADYNDIDGLRRLALAHRDELAAIILEPMLGGGGCIPATQAFLRAVGEVARETGALFLLDEVMTSRLAFTGLHGAHGVTPDLVTMGKYLGGGASFGCFGGRADIMDRFDPARRDAYSHGGTFNNNILSMAGGMAGFTRVLTHEASVRVNETGEDLRNALNAALAERGLAATVTGRGSLMNLHFVAGPVTGPAQLDGTDPRLLALFHVEMLLAGFYVAPRGMIALSLPFGNAEAAAFRAAFATFLDTHSSILPRVS